MALRIVLVLIWWVAAHRKTFGMTTFQQLPAVALPQLCMPCMSCDLNPSELSTPLSHVMVLCRQHAGWNSARVLTCACCLLLASCSIQACPYQPAPVGPAVDWRAVCQKPAVWQGPHREVDSSRLPHWSLRNRRCARRDKRHDVHARDKKFAAEAGFNGRRDDEASIHASQDVCAFSRPQAHSHLRQL